MKKYNFKELYRTQKMAHVNFIMFLVYLLTIGDVLHFFELPSLIRLICQSVTPIILFRFYAQIRVKKNNF